MFERKYELAVPSEQILEDAAETPDVDPIRVRLFKQELWRHEPERADGRNGTAIAHLNKLLVFDGVVEVGDLNETVTREISAILRKLLLRVIIVPQDIGGLDVAVHNVPVFMQIHQSFANLLEHAFDLGLSEAKTRVRFSLEVLLRQLLQVVPCLLHLDVHAEILLRRIILLKAPCQHVIFPVDLVRCCDVHMLEFAQEHDFLDGVVVDHGFHTAVVFHFFEGNLDRIFVVLLRLTLANISEHLILLLSELLSRNGLEHSCVAAFTDFLVNDELLLGGVAVLKTCLSMVNYLYIRALLKLLHFLLVKRLKSLLLGLSVGFFFLRGLWLLLLLGHHV